MISSETISQDEVMVSFDVESLFTNVPVDQALMIIHEKLVHDDTLQDRTALTPDHVHHATGNMLKDHLLHLPAGLL